MDCKAASSSDASVNEASERSTMKVRSKSMYGDSLNEQADALAGAGRGKRRIRRLGSAYERTELGAPPAWSPSPMRPTPFTKCLSTDGFLLSSSGRKLDTFKGGWMCEGSEDDETPSTLQRAKMGRFLSAQDFFEKWFSGKTRLSSCDLHELERHEEELEGEESTNGVTVAAETRSLLADAFLRSSSSVEFDN
ncbi:hypothetical protein FVE85_8380 [Porphyridium purpureum]|uniref:Uncharacterized protein n=1 Tax=Porphyridium purpureum TaxID=35688 RepID=A0A5J4YKT8_PORPP|nr:hypothetical protein FVE85_8380 [Porphyridium purpureum]|eukprot:POR8016..scf244_11